MAAEETPELTMAVESPRKESRMRTTVMLIWRWWGRMVLWYTVSLSKLMKAYCELQGLSTRQTRFPFEGQPINETDMPAQLEIEEEIKLMCSSSREQVSTEEGTCYFTPELCSSTSGRHFQLENHKLVSPHPDYYSTVFFILSFSFSLFLCHIESNWCMCTSMLIIFFLLNGQWYVFVNIE